MKTVIAVAIVLATTGCTTAPKDISPMYVSPMTYTGFSCEQTAAESRRLQVEIATVGGRLEEARGNDSKLFVGGLFLWPTFFALGGMQDKQGEYSMLRGQYAALEQSAIAKGCDVQFHPKEVPNV